jgi:retron-type reverse transcriptase
MQSADYVLKCDIRKYFASVDHAILKQILRRKIGCPRTLALIDRIIDHCNPQQEMGDYFPGDDLFTPLNRRRGLPIGNQTSQFFANVYLDPLDHFIKEELGCQRYIRYVDDFVVLDDSKERLWAIRDAVARFLQDRLRLNLHPHKQTVSPVGNGIDFLGYRVYPTHRRLRRTSGYRFRRKLKRMAEQYRDGRINERKVRQRVASWIGHAAHADTYGLRTALFENVVFVRR